MAGCWGWSCVLVGSCHSDRAASAASGGICVPTVFEPQIPPLGLKSSVGMTKLKDLYGAPKGAPLQNNFAIDFLTTFEVVTESTSSAALKSLPIRNLPYAIDRYFASSIACRMMRSGTSLTTST